MSEPSRTPPPLTEVPVTGEIEAVSALRAQRPFGVRLWLALMFAAVGTLAGTSVYLFVEGSSEGAADRESEAQAQFRTGQVRRDIERQFLSRPFNARNVRNVSGPTLAEVRSEAYRAWIFDNDGSLLTRPDVLNVDIAQVPRYRSALEQALDGRPFTTELAGNRNLVALPISPPGTSEIEGALVALAGRPEEVQQALDALRSERLTALAIAVIVAGVIGFLVASLITTRVKNLAAAAGEISEGRLDMPLSIRGRDEIGDLGRAFNSMRLALRETFTALSSERDRLTKIFSALGEAVLVIDRNGEVRFANPAAEPLISDHRPLEQLTPWIRRASERGTAEHGGIRIGSSVYALQARDLPAEEGVLVVVRDRTEELRREIAEREFVSNAAHELRNPIAGISGAIEVLRAGAKDDPEARDHFLQRLSEDAERVSRLTRSLLTLARMEAIGESEAEVVSVGHAAEEAAAAAGEPEGLTVELDIEHDLGAQADPVLLRQVLIGLLTNAYKNTPAPGKVTIRGCRTGDDEVRIEVADTGTGIAEEERDRVFERFYRGSGSLEVEGFGLGLSIAKRMVNVMGGEIGVDSEPGVGSTFWIKLPLARPSPTPVA